MHEFIDTYVKILVALISFVAPIMVLLLSIFSEAIVIVKNKYQEEQINIKSVIMDQAGRKDDYAEFGQIIKKSLRKLRWCKVWNEYRLNLLKPKRQIIRIFSALSISIGLIMFDMIVKDKYFKMYNHNLSVWLIVLSFSTFIIAVIFFMQLGWAIINAKSVISAENKSEKINKENIIIKK